MAVWQFIFDFVPEQFLLDTYGLMPPTLASEVRKQGNYFQHTPYHIKELLPYLEQLGTADADSWNGSAYYHGEADNDATAWFDKETKRVEAISCRLDMRQFDEFFTYGVLSLAAAVHCQLMTRRGQLFRPTVQALLQTMEQSNAARFVADPLKFLNDLSKDDTAIS